MILIFSVMYSTKLLGAIMTEGNVVSGCCTCCQTKVSQSDLPFAFTDTSLAGIEQLNKSSVYSAVVTALKYSISDYHHDAYDKDFDDFDFRDPAERLALLTVHCLILEFGVSGFVKAGLIPRWLAKEPFGETDAEKQDNVMNLLRRGNTLSYIVLRLIKDPRSLAQLKVAGLVHQSLDIINDKIDVRMINGEGTAGEMEAPDMDFLEGSTSRVREQSIEEQNRRRRHREAMVLNDGSQPIGRESIYERTEETSAEEDRLQRVTNLLGELTSARRNVLTEQVGWTSD
jgi:hypothetical protein